MPTTTTTTFAAASDRDWPRPPFPPLFIFMFLENYGVRKLEALFALLIAVSFAWMFSETKPDAKELLIEQAGVVGCIIMPHNVFLHMALVQSREVDPRRIGRVREAIRYYSIESTIALVISFIINLFVTTVFAKAFFGTGIADIIRLGNEGQFLEDRFGGGYVPILYIWAAGLLAAGQSSTITGTQSGVFIDLVYGLIEGGEWKTFVMGGDGWREMVVVTVDGGCR
ncbi:metal transporter Nramp3-like protein [Tanacetum coccineum]